MRRKEKWYVLGLAAFVLASLGVVWLAWNLGAPDQPAATAAEEIPEVGDGAGRLLPGAVLGDGEHKSGILLDVGGPSQPLVAFTGVFGRVLDERDQAVGYAFIRLHAARDDVWIRTDEQGIFTWQPPPESDVRGLTAQAISPTHAPSAAQPVQPGVEAMLHVGPGGTVRGRVVDATGAPVKGFLIAINDARIEVAMPGGAKAFAPQPFTQDDGSFELGPLQPGRFDLRAQAPDHAPGFARDVPVVSGQVTSGIVIAMSAVAVVRGRVTAASDGRPLERAHVMLFDPTATLPPRTAMTDAAGEFRMPAVAAGRRSSRITIEGFLTELASGIDVPAAGEVVRDVQLHQAGPGERFSFQGIGATLDQADRGIVIAQLMDDAPAARAGLQAGDVILTVDRVAAAGMQVDQVVEMIRGEAGVPVSLEIERNGQRLTVTVERSRMVVKSPH